MASSKKSRVPSAVHLLFRCVGAGALSYLVLRVIQSLGQLVLG